MTVRVLMLRVPILCVLALAVHACAEPSTQVATLDVSSVLGGVPDPAFARVVAARPFLFPDDHGPHPAFKTEWWYLTANLADEQGRRFGVQFTIFRSALAPPDPVPAAPASIGPPVAVPAVPGASPAEPASAWTSRQIYMAHVALTDATGEAFHSEERFSRAALGLAGATASPFRVWLEDWQMAAIAPDGETDAPDGESIQPDGKTDAPGGEAIFPLHIRAVLRGAEIDLRLDAGKPMALQGDRGFSPKGDGVGDASHYYSFTRLAASGRLTIGGAIRDVEGTAWFDREWSTSVLGREQTGWDWFALQLADGRDLMVFELRSVGGEPVRDGLVVDVDGATERLSGSEFEIEVLGEWISPASGVRYPSGWRIQVPAQNLDLMVEPLLQDQEHMGAFRYWEGAVRVFATGGSPTERLAGGPAGVGYVELTGYAEVDGARRISERKGRD